MRTYLVFVNVRSSKIVPKLDEVRAEIERTLEESKIESSLQKYLDEARERAEIVILNPL